MKIPDFGRILPASVAFLSKNAVLPSNLVCKVMFRIESRKRAYKSLIPLTNNQNLSLSVSSDVGHQPPSVTL